jgi:exonuclease III
MRILGWNCRGICNASTTRALRATIKVQNPDVIFLCETKASKDKMKDLAISIGFPEHVIVGATGKAGGLCLFWSNAIDVQVLEFDSQTIAITVRDEFCLWSLIGFYGPPYQAKRRKAWCNLSALLRSLNGPWMCFGDFNCVVSESEKQGGIRGSPSTPTFLKDLLFDLEAIDLGYSGNQFTWWNKRWGKRAIRERLDRAISNPSWRLAFPKAIVLHLGAINSDHAPLLIDTNPAEDFCPRPFRFAAIWTKDPRCGSIISKAWSSKVQGTHSYILCRKQALTTVALKKWNKNVFGHCSTKIKELTDSIEEIQLHERTETRASQEAYLHGELNEWLRRNETLWRQKSREMWLKEGDKNSKFFHLSTVIRRKRNSIDAIKDDAGVWITSKRGIREHVVDKFTQLFTEETVNFPLDLENLISPTISPADNLGLCRIPSAQEIKETIFDMLNQKSPGPDGLPALFYKKYWETEGTTVTEAV